ncbi:helix-turn-helix transcriptional regulator [Caldimonas brevitalea]|uniref:HTH luxR-type domain-containing protein n=1 Tax=Caldimonas brevitalea TaxID=413882 RepID=A0A0G3BZV0_9BURK|nr:LuxR family transcriptional regulator [Caldimonas brevitalea]AKJ32065.1 hypothetical protein AAW51_5374 [Caldimonas brevitalea]
MGNVMRQELGGAAAMWYDAVMPRAANGASHERSAPLPRAAPASAPPAVMLHDEPPARRLPTRATPGHPSLLTALMGSESPAERQRTVSALVRTLGFEWLGYWRITQVADQAVVPLSFCTTYADRTWAERYFAQAYHEIDPRLQLALRSSLPAVWALDQLQAQANGDLQGSRLRRFVADLAATGMRSGVMFALPVGSSTERHVVSLLSATPGNSWIGDGLLGQVLTLALCLHEFYTRYSALPQVEPGGTPRLTPIQREILACVSQGLGDKEIASRLDLTLHNVDYHMRQLRRRFSVRNRVQLMQAAQSLDLR